jgi:farnesol dehydrogenase
MAALVSVWRHRRLDFDEVNVGGLQNALKAAATAGVDRVVYTSSFLALPPRGHTAPLQANDYQRTKVDADRAADAAVRAGTPLIRLYPGVIYGPGTITEGNLVGRLIADHLKGRLPGIIGPERPWSYAFIDDVAAGHCAALERGAPGARYVLGGENAPQMRVFEIVRGMTGRSLPRRIPFPVASALGAMEEARVRLFGGTPLLTRGTVDIFRCDWSLDSSAAVRELSYPMTPLVNGVYETVQSLTAGGAAAR